jgi:hypothetical protein
VSLGREETPVHPHFQVPSAGASAVATRLVANTQARLSLIENNQLTCNTK